MNWREYSKVACTCVLCRQGGMWRASDYTSSGTFDKAIADKPMTATEVLAREAIAWADTRDRIARAMADIQARLNAGERISVPGGGVVYQAQGSNAWMPDEYAGYSYALTEVFLAFNGSTCTVHKTLAGAQQHLQPGAGPGEWYAATLNGKKGDLWYARDTNLRMLRIERKPLDD